jgi:uncharacterized damage-inducible protein DinB
MNEMKRIVDLLDRAGHGDAWHGPSVDATVAGVTAAQGAARPLAEGHSIWEIALHIAAWDRVVARRLAGEQVEPTPAEDWPLVGEATDAEWARVVRDLGIARRELRDALLAFDERRLDEIVPGRKDSFYVMVHGVVQHDLYHAGQIALLKKAYR